MLELNLSCTTSTMFAFAALISSTISLNAPGLSGNKIDNLSKRPIVANPLSTICPKRYMSTLPPVSIGTTFFPGDGFADIK